MPTVIIVRIVNYTRRCLSLVFALVRLLYPVSITFSAPTEENRLENYSNIIVKFSSPVAID